MSRRGRIAVAGWVALAGCATLCLLVGRSGGLLIGRWGLFALIVGWIAAGAAATALLVRAGGTRSLAVLGAAIALQGCALTAGPQLSDDLYRYVWDARVAAAGISPYAYPPQAPELQALRRLFLWPTPAGCATPREALPRGARADPYGNNPVPGGCTRINRPEVRTIYPPTAELAFRLAALAPGPRASELQVQLPAALASVALTGVLLAVLRRQARDRGWALLYAASPLAALEAGMDGHVDVLAGLLAVPLLLVLAGTAKGRLWAVAAGALLAVVTLTKLYPAVLGAVVVARYGWRSGRTLVAAAAALATVALLYLPAVLAVGGRVLGYLPGYLTENGYDSGGRYVLLNLVLADAPPRATAAVALALALGVLAAGCLVPVEPVLGALARRGALVLGGLFLILTPGNAWYCTLLIALAVLAGRPEWLGVVVASYTVYVDTLLRSFTVWPGMTYGLAGLLVAAAAVARRRPVLARARPAAL